ncbi:MAG: acyl-CoA thioesterase II [Deltaproteobacteria bacterium]|nr:acyl-CoA thioesterase II [Deltaproteobacteria bacterium]
MANSPQQDALDLLVSVLDLEELELNLFRGRTPKEDRLRVFGGQVAGQALVAAGRTVAEGAVHSLHAYFLRPGDPSIPILYQVDRIRDGRSFATRRVVAIQHGHAIFNLSASFQIAESGLEHQIPMPDAPDPESLPSFKERTEHLLTLAPAELRRWLMRDRPIDARHVDPVDYLKPKKRPPRQLIWIRADGTLPDSPLLHQCVVAYASDMTLMDTATLPHAISWVDSRFQMASLDHAMWFHRTFRADEWLLYAQESPNASGSRGFTTGSLFTRDGTLVVSVAQEGLIRQRRA